MINPRAIAALGVGFGPGAVARLGFFTGPDPAAPAWPSFYRAVPALGRRLAPVRATAVAGFGFEVAARARLRLAGVAGGEFAPAGAARVGLRLGASSAGGAAPHVSATADVVDVVLEMLLLTS